MTDRLLKIAKSVSYEIAQRGDLEYRGSDQDDCIELTVGAVEALLEKAYELGREDACIDAFRSVIETEREKQAREESFRLAMQKAYRVAGEELPSRAKTRR